ncbi:MAG: NfeD family protein [Candidatus Binatia bacterium]
MAALRHWFDLSLGICAVGLFLWIGKDFALYPLVKSAYEPHVKTGVAELIGLDGVAEQDLAPYGQVRIRGELWRAEIAPDTPPIPKGKRVHVVEAEGMKLFVIAPVEETEENDAIPLER